MINSRVRNVFSHFSDFHCTAFPLLWGFDQCKIIAIIFLKCWVAILNVKSCQILCLVSLYFLWFNFGAILRKKWQFPQQFMYLCLYHLRLCRIQQLFDTLLDVITPFSSRGRNSIWRWSGGPEILWEFFLGLVTDVWRSREITCRTGNPLWTNSFPSYFILQGFLKPPQGLRAIWRVGLIFPYSLGRAAFFRVRNFSFFFPSRADGSRDFPP